MPRGRKIAVKNGASNKKLTAKINHEEAERIRLIIDQEEENIEADMRQELARMVDERDLRMSHDLNNMNNRNRRMMMWIGVSAVMLVVVVIWVSTLDFTVNNSYQLSGQQTDEQSLAEYKRNLDQTFEEVMTKIEQLKEQSRQIADQVSEINANPTGSSPMISDLKE